MIQRRLHTMPQIYRY